MILFIIGIACGLDSEFCTDIFCKGSNISPNCMEVGKTSISIGSCSSTQYCPGISTILSASASYETLKCKALPSTSACKEFWGEGKSPAGWYCCKDSNCASNSCTENICEGKSKGENCDSTEECQSDYYCNGSCSGLLSDGAGCDSDEVCKVGSGCNKGICTGLFSLKIGEASEKAKFCMSYYVENGVCDAIFVSLSKTNQTLSTPTFKCEIGESCHYYSKHTEKILFTEKCLCAGVSGSDKGYCPYVEGMGNIDWTTRFRYTTCNCSGEIAHSFTPEYLLACSSINNYNYYLYTNITAQRKYWNLYQSGAIDSCALELDLFSKKNYFEEYSNYIFLSSLTMLLI